MDEPGKTDKPPGPPSPDPNSNSQASPSPDPQDKPSSLFPSYKNWLKGKYFTDKYSSAKEKINTKYQKSLSKIKNYKEKANEKYHGQLEKFGKYKKSINEKYQKRKEDLNIYVKTAKHLLPFTFIIYQREKFVNSYSFPMRLGIFGGSVMILSRYCRSLTLLFMFSFCGGFFLIPDLSTKINR